MTKKSSFFVVLYAANISNKLFPILKKHNLDLVYSCQNNLKKFIKTGKDSLDPMHESGVIYKIDCSNCDASYVGQTKRQLRTRIKEHKSDIYKKSGPPSVISLHRLDFQHEFNWDNIKILDREPSFYKRLIAEMIHIKKQSHSTNNRTRNSSRILTFLFSIFFLS